jgi:hypothetical protein
MLRFSYKGCSIYFLIQYFIPVKLLWLVELWSIITCIKFRIGKLLPNVCSIVFGFEQQKASSIFDFNSASVYTIQEAPAKLEGLKFNANKRVVRVALIYSHYRLGQCSH